MELNVFYSWQSDIKSNKNRGLINDCLKKALDNIYKTNKKISEYSIESDSRNGIGTPDLVASIFEKINACDIFISDISIVNSEIDSKLEYRKMPNPNIMLELGYASKSIGWTNIICVFNTEFGKIEELPFDIRFRKPIIYDTSNNIPKEKEKLVKIFEVKLMEIIDNRVSDLNYFAGIKKQIDLGMQAILIDLCHCLFSENESNNGKYSYSLLLNYTYQNIVESVVNRKFLGFELFKNIEQNIDDFTDFFNSSINTYFLSDIQKKIIVKLIYELQNYKSIIAINNLSKISDIKDTHRILNANKMNENNPPNSYILLEKNIDDKYIVRSSGLFKTEKEGFLLNYYSFNKNKEIEFCKSIYSLIQNINEWIKITGNYFISNLREITEI